MKNNSYMIISGTIFGLITLGQLIRLIYRVPVQIGALNLPLWPSVIAVIVAFGLCIWAFRLARS